MSNLIFAVRQWLMKAIATVRNIPFTIKLKCLVWFYGGGANIPQAVLNKHLKIISSKEEGNALEKTMGAIGALQSIAKKVGIDYLDTHTAANISCMMRNEYPDEETAKYVDGYIDRPDINRAIWEMMVELGDLKQHTINYHWPTPEDKAILERWKDSTNRESVL